MVKSRRGRPLVSYPHGDYNRNALQADMISPRIGRPFFWLALVALPLLAAFDPVTTWWFPSCPLRALTGWQCPLCGTLRAIHALLHGAPRVALSLNPLITLGGLAGFTALAYDVVDPVRTSRFEGLAARCFSARGFAALIAFGVLRNLPAHFGWMAR
jgi:hypothetical protein